MFTSMILWVLASCASPSAACLDYVSVYQDCYDEAVEAGLDVDVDTSDPEGFCLELDASFTEEQWACNAAAYASGDCSTEEGLDAILAEVEGC